MSTLSLRLSILSWAKCAASCAGSSGAGSGVGTLLSWTVTSRPRFTSTRFTSTELQARIRCDTPNWDAGVAIASDRHSGSGAHELQVKHLEGEDGMLQGIRQQRHQPLSVNYSPNAASCRIRHQIPSVNDLRHPLTAPETCCRKHVDSLPTSQAPCVTRMLSTGALRSPPSVFVPHPHPALSKQR